MCGSVVADRAHAAEPHSDTARARVGTHPGGGATPQACTPAAGP